MADEMKLAKAQKAYAIICSALDQRNWHYNKDEDKFVTYFGVNGEDLPMQFIIRADEERQLIRLHSPLSFKIGEDKRVDGSVATNMMNYKMADGSFEYNLADGTIVFKMTASYHDTEISEDLIHYMIGCSCAMVDKYNDGLLALSKGIISINEFVQTYM